jgi:hypothetical protein
VSDRRHHHRPEEDEVTRILVTGSRTWTNETIIQGALRKAWMDLGSDPETVLVSGACPIGADRLAENWWVQSGMPLERHPARWRPNGVLDSGAGFKRNKEMVDLGADACVAFHMDGSRGTGHTIGLARAAGIPTTIYSERTLKPRD